MIFALFLPFVLTIYQDQSWYEQESLQACGCTHGCTNMDVLNVSACLPAPAISYLEYDNTSCSYGQAVCPQPDYSTNARVGDFLASAIRLTAPNQTLYCGSSMASIYDPRNQSKIETVDFLPSQGGSCVATFRTRPEVGTNRTTYLYLRNLLYAFNASNLQVSFAGPAFAQHQSALIPDAMVLTLNKSAEPAYACCEFPDVVTGTTCNGTVPVTLDPTINEGEYLSFLTPPLSCASSIAPTPDGGTLYTYNVTLTNVTSPTCPPTIPALSNTQTVLVPLFVPATLSPTRNTPPPTTVSPTVLYGGVTSIVQTQAPTSVCPLTVSGFGIPQVVVNYTAVYVRSLINLTLNAGDEVVVGEHVTPQLLWSDNFTKSWALDAASTCVPTEVLPDGSCAVLFVTAHSSARALVDGRWYGAVTDIAQMDAPVSGPCPPALTCAADPTAAVIVTPVRTAPYSAANQVNVDLMVQDLAVGSSVSIDTVRIVMTDTAGNRVSAVDLSAQKKVIDINTTTSPYYADALFCRYDGTELFFDVGAGRWNAWAGSKLAGLNATLCAFVADPARDRMLFVPANWPVAYFPPVAGFMTAQVTWTVVDAFGNSTCFTSSVAQVAITTTNLTPVPIIPLIAASLALVATVGITAAAAGAAAAGTPMACLAWLAGLCCPMLARKKLLGKKRPREGTSQPPSGPV